MPVLLDGGIRRGSDVVKALALGAAACLIARPQLFGLAVAGEAGVARVLDILRREIDRTMGLMGVTRHRRARPGLPAPALGWNALSFRHPDSALVGRLRTRF